MKEIHLGLEEKAYGDSDIATGMGLKDWEYLIIDINTSG